MLKTQVMTFLTGKRINTQLFIDGAVTLYIEETQIRNTTNKGTQKMTFSDWRNAYALGRMLD